MTATDFTNCPFTALQYASKPKGVVLVIDVPVDHARVSEELWLGTRAKRYNFWGSFDSFVVAEIPAKELRAEVRRKGVVALSGEDKGTVLRFAIRDRLARR